MDRYEFGTGKVLSMTRKIDNAGRYVEHRVYDLEGMGCDNYEDSMVIEALNEEQLSENEGRRLIGFLERFIQSWKISRYLGKMWKN